MKLGRRILAVLDETGAREPGLLQRMLRATDAEYQRAIGWLCLKGLVVFRGRTKGRVIARNGRRMAA